MFEYLVGFAFLYYAATQFSNFQQAYRDGTNSKKNGQSYVFTTEYTRDDYERNSVLVNEDPSQFAMNQVKNHPNKWADDLQYEGPSDNYESTYNATQQLKPWFGQEMTNEPETSQPYPVLF